VEAAAVVVLYITILSLSPLEQLIQLRLDQQMALTLLLLAILREAEVTAVTPKPEGQQVQALVAAPL
jgi:hypothetical protein